MAILKEALGNAPGLNMLDVSNDAEQIVVGFDASLVGWGLILPHEDKNQNWNHFC